MGKVSGLFISTEQEIDTFLVDRTVYFGEILGKHSEVSIDFKKDSFTSLDISKEAVQEIVKVSRNRTVSGYNPFEYVDEEMKIVFISLDKKRTITSENYCGYIFDNISKAISRFKEQYPQEPLEFWNVYIEENDRGSLKWKCNLSDFKE